MKKYFIYILLLVLITASRQILAADPEVVRFVDLNRYSGKWYEIARLPNSFESRDARNVVASYSLNSGGTIRVENSCIEKNGALNKVVGLAKVSDPVTNAKLAVSFFDIFGFRPIWGDYWILGLGENYSYSVVGDRSRKYAWILSRDPQLNKNQLEEAIQILKKNGFEIDRLIYPKQS